MEAEKPECRVGRVREGRAEAAVRGAGTARAAPVHGADTPHAFYPVLAEVSIVLGTSCPARTQGRRASSGPARGG
jgi:hypothetical protein